MRLSVSPIGHDLGLLLHLPGMMALPSLAVAAIAGEWFAMPGFLLTAALSLGLGQLLCRGCRGADEEKKPQPWIVVALAWLCMAALGAVPFYLAALTGTGLSETTRVFANPLNALFEGMSGFTSTGLTMSQDPSTLPYSLQWWRSFTEWVGGVGVVVLALALIEPSEDQYALYSAEARSKKFGDSVTRTVRRMWAIFLGYTAFAILAFLLAGMPLWEALNHGLTGIATGGFSVISGSFQNYDAAIKTTAIIIMVLGAVSFYVHYLLLGRRDFAAAARQSQLRTFLVLLVSGLLLLPLILDFSNEPAAFIDTVFQWVSALATCGFSAAELIGWPQAALFMLILAMVLGGMAGSTAGGLKLNRLTWLAKALYWRLAYIWSPDDAPVRHRFDGEDYARDRAWGQVGSAALMALLWLATLAAGTLALAVATQNHYNLHEVLFEAASALGSVGLSVGIAGAELSAAGKSVLIVLMWMGRLEILAVIVLLTSPFMTAWKVRAGHPHRAYD